MSPNLEDVSESAHVVIESGSQRLIVGAMCVSQFYRGGHEVDAGQVDDDATPNMATCRLDTAPRSRSYPTPDSGSGPVSRLSTRDTFSWQPF